MRLLIACAVVALAAACSPSAPDKPVDPAAETQKLTAYLNAEFEEELAMSPMRLTQLGRKEQYDRLDGFSEADVQRQLAWRRESVAGMEKQFDRTKLSDDAQTSWDIWESELGRAEKRATWLRWAYVFGYGGPHTDIPTFLISFHKVDQPSDMDAYISRLGELARAMDQLTERAKLAAADGVRTPKFGYERTAKEAQSIITGAPFGPGQDSPLWADIKTKIGVLLASDRATSEQGAEWEAGAKAALNEKVKPAYQRLIAWLKEDMKQAPSGKVGALTLPKGPEWYDVSLELLTTTNMTADEIHELGLREVERIHGEMDKIRVATGFKGDAKAFFEFMRTDPQFYLPNTDEGRAAYLKKAEGYLEAMQVKLPEYFGRLPKAPLVVKRVEAFRETPGGAAHYFRPTPDGKQPGIFYAHLVDMKAVSVWALESLAYHEGVPGHHMQIAIQNELTDIPLFRTQYGYSSFSEGWGLYAEELGKTMGFFADPYNDFGRLSSELWRSVRLVVDTGLHAKGWTEEEAVQWALANSPRPETAVRSEVRRFLLWPGQATTYKIGMITIQKLRDEAKAALGTKFDLRAFHDVVIGGGGMPLPVLEAKIHRWIDTQKAPAKKVCPCPPPALGRGRTRSAPRRYRPLKFPGRRSATDFTPSLKSSVFISHCCSANSRSVAERTAAASSARSVLRVERTARGAFSAISAASWWAAGRRASCATTWSTRPIVRASSAFRRRPVRNMSAASCLPTRRGRVWVRPKPGWKPSLVKLAAKRASGVAIRKSAMSARPRPAPMAAPWTAAMMGSSVAWRRTAWS